MPSAARLVHMSTSPRNIWAWGWFEAKDKALVNFLFGRSKGHKGIRQEGRCSDRVRRHRSNERFDIVRIGSERAIEIVPRLCQIVGSWTLGKPSCALKAEVHRVGVRGLHRASCLGTGELGPKLAC